MADLLYFTWWKCWLVGGLSLSWWGVLVMGCHGRRFLWDFQHFLLCLVKIRNHWKHYPRLFGVEIEPSWVSMNFQQRQKFWFLIWAQLQFHWGCAISTPCSQSWVAFWDPWGCLLLPGWTFPALRSRWWLSLLCRFSSWLSSNTPRWTFLSDL